MDEAAHSLVVRAGHLWTAPQIEQGCASSGAAVSTSATMLVWPWDSSTGTRT